MTLPIKPLGQRDPKWANQRLGTVNSTTIGSDGCVITSASMMYTYFGKPTTPDVLDNFLTDNRLYTNGNLWTPQNVGKWLSSMAFEKMVMCKDTPAPISEIKAKLDAKQVVFVWVINQGVFHCTLAIGYEGNEIIVNDPWIGDTVQVNKRWGTSSVAIQEVDYYKGVPIVTPVPQPTQPAEDRRGYWFDLLNKSIWNKPKEEVTDDMVNSFAKEYPTQRDRSGMWDKLCLKAGITDDSNKVTVDQLYAVIDQKDTELQNNLNSIITDKNTQIATLSKQLESLRIDIADKNSRLESLTTQAQKTVELTNELNQCKALSSKWTEKETSYLARIKTLETKIANVKSPIKLLLVSILEKLS